MSALDTFLSTVSNADKGAFLAAFTTLNPSWRGAHVDDVLEHLADLDLYCGLIDSFEHADLPHAGHAVRMAIVLTSEACGAWEPTARRLLGVA